METTQALILFSIFNIIFTALVGGIVVYVIQKKIDATIQKSLYEHQIKFSKVYPKTLEVLEGYHQKLLECSRRSSALGSRIALSQPSVNPPDKKTFAKEYSDLSLAVRDVNACFENNRIHFPDVMVHDLEEIHDRANALALISQTSADTLSASMQLQIEYFKMSCSMLGLSPNEEFNDEMGPRLLPFAVNQEFRKLLERFEKLYKSVSDASDS